MSHYDIRLFIYNTDVYILCGILQCSIINVILVIVKDSNQLYSLGGIWCQKSEMMTLFPLKFEPEINRLRHSVQVYYYANSQVTVIRGFRFIVVTYRHTHVQTPPHTHTSSG